MSIGTVMKTVKAPSAEMFAKVSQSTFYLNKEHHRSLGSRASFADIEPIQ